MTKVTAQGVLTTALAVSALALVSSTVFAEDAPAATASNTGGLQEVVVTARYREENLQQTPIAITAVNAAMLEQRNAPARERAFVVYGIRRGHRAGSRIVKAEDVGQ